MSKFKFAASVLSVAGLGALLGTPALASARAPAVTTTLTAIRAAHHPGFDRLVFDFAGKLPAERSARYLATVFADPSGKVVPVSGSARLLVRFFASGVGASLNQRSFNLPGLLQAVKAGSFESVLPTDPFLRSLAWSHKPQSSPVGGTLHTGSADRACP